MEFERSHFLSCWKRRRSPDSICVFVRARSSSCGSLDRGRVFAVARCPDGWEIENSRGARRNVISRALVQVSSHSGEGGRRALVWDRRQLNIPQQHSHHTIPPNGHKRHEAFGLFITLGTVRSSFRSIESKTRTEKHIPTFRGLWVMNHQLTTEPDTLLTC